MNTELKNLKGLNHRELIDFIGSIDEKSFRARQLFQWIYQKNVHSFDEMTNLSKMFRQTLEEIHKTKKNNWQITHYRRNVRSGVEGI